MSSSAGFGRPPSGSWNDESPTDARRYLAALRRSRRLLVSGVFVTTVIVLAISLALPKHYSAVATIFYSPEGSIGGPPEATSAERELTTVTAFATSAETNQAAAKEVAGATPESIESSVAVEVDRTANLIHIEGTGKSGHEAAEIANAVAKSFLKVQKEFQEASLIKTKENLEAQIPELEAQGDNEDQIEAIRRRASHLTVQAASAGTDLQLSEPAPVPSSPSSPKPVVNAVLAFFASAFILFLFVLGREQLRPTLNDPREVSRLLRVPILASIPYAGGRLSRKKQLEAAVVAESYRSLGASIQTLMPPSGDRPKLVLVTSAVHGEGKSTVAARLGETLALTGHKTLIVSGDLRWPTLHEIFGVPLVPGLTDLIGLADRSGNDGDTLRSTVRQIPVSSVDGRPSGGLDLLTSGSQSGDPAALLGGGTAREFFQSLYRSDYGYVLVDGPPALGIADIQPLAAYIEHTLLVTRLDRVNAENVADTAELLRTIGGQPFGAVVIGAKMNPSPYYLTQAPFRLAATPSPAKAPAADNEPADDKAPAGNDRPVD